MLSFDVSLPDENPSDSLEDTILVVPGRIGMLVNTTKSARTQG
jgi:hypothetical protein